MLALYLFLLIVGGGLAGLSLIGGALGGDLGEVDLDFDADAGTGAKAMGSGWWDAFSLQSLIYASFGTGAAGTVLHLMWDGGAPIPTAILAVAAGVGSGMLAGVLLSYLKRSASGDVLTEASFEGLAGTVSLPLAHGRAGRIRVRRGHREHVLRALPFSTTDDGDEPERWSRVVVVEVKGGVAYVTPAGKELEPPGP